MFPTAEITTNLVKMNISHPVAIKKKGKMLEIWERRMSKKGGRVRSELWLDAY